MELYNKLLKCGIFRASPRVKTNFEKKKTLLDPETSQMFENGVALGKYLIVLRDALRRNNQSLNIDQSKIQQLKAQSTPQARLFNWNILCTELDKIGIEIDTDSRSLIVAGDQEQILTAFTRIERFLVKIAGKQILNFDGIKSDVNIVPPQLENVGNVTEKSNARRGAKPNQKKVVKDGVDILTMNQEREPIDTESTLELILNTLCRAFQMKPKQAAALLTNNNQFLIHSIVKGVKGKYEPLISWYQDIYANSKHLTSLLELEIEQFPNSTNFQKVLATLSCGLYSHNLDICRWCSKLLTKIGYDFGQNQQMFNQAMSWFLEKEGGLELSLHSLKKHSDLAEDFVAFVTQFSSVNDQVEQVYKTELKKYFSSPLEYVNAINDLFPFMVAQSQQDIKRSGILDFWIESCIRQSDNDGKHSYDERIAALTLLAEIWLAFTAHIDQKEELANSVLQMLKRGARDKHRPIRTVAVCSLFRLLDKFSEEKNTSAPSIYKTLIFSLVENPNDSTLRELYYINFISLYEANQTIPVGLLVEPLIKQIQVTEGVSFFYKIFDFDFFSFIAKHPKLNIQSAIPMADLMAKIYLNEVTYSSAAAVPFVQICSRFIHDEQMQEFIIKFETICFSMLMGLEKNAEELQFKHQQILLANSQAKHGQKKLLALPAPPQSLPFKKISGKKLTKEEKMKQLKEQDEDVSRRLKKTHIVEMTMKVQNLRSEDINEQLRDMLLSANKRFNELYGYFNKGIMALLKWWGDPESIMQSYIRAVDERESHEKAERDRMERDEKDRQRREVEDRERKEREERERRQREAQEKIKQLRASGDYDTMNDEDRRLMIGYDSAEMQFREGSANASNKQSLRNSMAVLPYTGTSGIRSLKNQKALQQIEKIKRNKQEKEEQKRLEEERKRLLDERKNKKLKEQLEKRKLELGVGIHSQEPKALIYKDGTVLSENDRLKKLAEQKLMIPSINLIDLDQEEERDIEAVNMYMKKYAKLWRNLYYKYSNSGFSSKQISNFDQYNEKSQTMNAAEMTKLLKDHDSFPNLINKAELQQLFRQINMKLFSRGDLQALDYNGYLSFMQQLAYFCFSRPPKDMSYLPPVESIRALVAQFEQATRARGNSTLLYEDPDASGMGDQQLIKALNEKLLYDPNYPVPEGYFKQVERTPLYEYRLSDQVRDQLPDSQIVAVELLDDFMNELFGLHILEPIVSFEERLKVRPNVRNAIKPQAEALNYMKKVEKRTKGQDTLNPYTSLTALEKQKLNNEIKPNLNVTLKLEVAQYPLKERPHVQEVAETLEEILQAAEKGLTYLPPRANRAPGQVWNEAKQKKHEDQSQQSEQQNLREELRKKRDQQVKSELSKIKEQKERDIEEIKHQREEKERQDKDDKKRQQDDVRRKLDNKKKQIEDSKNLKLEEVMKKRQEEEEKNKEFEEKKKRERVEFMKKQKQNLQEEFNQAKREREELAARQADLNQKEKEYQARIRANMENFINESKQDRHKEQEERKQINEFIRQQDVENVFALYDKALKHMFKFYASQDKKDLDFSLEKSMNTCNFREFIRFTYQQNIVPALIPPEDSVQIYRELVRERLDQITSEVDSQSYLNDKLNSQVLDYDYFKKSLIRIAIMAQDSLGGQKEDLLLQKLDVETRKKQEEQKKREKLKKQQDDKHKIENKVLEEMKEEYKSQMQKTQKSPSKTGKGAASTDVQYEINQTIKEREDAFFDKWMKQREAQGISLKKRIIGKEKEGTKKTVIKKKVTINGANTQNDDIDDVREGEDMDDNGQNTKGKLGYSSTNNIGSSAVVRKTKALKALKDLEEQEHIKDNLAQTKIENKHIRKDLNVMVVTAKTIEALMKFMGIEPEDTKQGLDNKLNQNRIEIQGQKPNKVKKQLKPNKLDTIRQGGGQNLNQSIDEEKQDHQSSHTTNNQVEQSYDGRRNNEEEQE